MTVSPSTSMIRGVLTLISTQPLTWAVSLAGAALIPRYLGVDGLGLLASITAVVGYVAAAACLGVPEYLARRTATHPQEGEADAGGALVLLTLASIALAVPVAVAVPIVGLSLPVDVLVVALIGMVIYSAQSVILSRLRGQERHRDYAWPAAGGKLLSMIAGIVVLARGGGLLGFLVTDALVSLVLLAVSWRIARFHLHRSAFSLVRWSALTRGGLPFLGWILMLRIQGGIVFILLAWLTNNATVGWYAAAYRIVGIPVFIPALIAMPLLPVLSRSIADERVFAQTLRRSVTAVILLTMPICAITAALGPTIPDLLGWGQAFDGSVAPLIILSVQMPLTAVNMILGIALVALHREHAWFKVMLVAAIFNPALNLILIPFFARSVENGAIGAAMVTVATECLLFVGALRLLPAGLLGRTLTSIGLKCVLAALAVAGVVTVIRPESWLLAVIAGGVTYVVLVLAFRLVHRSDLVACVRLAQPMLPARLRARPVPEGT